MEDPKISERWAGIRIEFPGASAERVESLVTDKIEQKLSEIEDIKTVNSTSSIGNSSLLIHLKAEVHDTDDTWSVVRDKIADVKAELPKDAMDPEFTIYGSRANSLIVALTWELETPANYAILSRLAEQLKAELLGVKSTEKVELVGKPLEEIVVEINPANLQALGLTPQEVAEQIRLSDAKVSAGKVQSDNNDLLIEVDTELDSIDRIQQIPIRVANNSGEVARLGDIAKVNKSAREPSSELAIINGRRAITVAALAESNKRVDQWNRETRQTIAAFKEKLPHGVGLEIIFSENFYVNNLFNSLSANFWFGVWLVLATTCFVMGWKSSLIVAASVPITIMLVFGCMKVLGTSLHQWTVTGLVMALGMLVDNVIIIVDEINHKLNWVKVNGAIKPERAIAKTVTYLAGPQIASTLTTVVAFLPMLFLPGDVGEFVGVFSLSVILALFCSQLLALTIVPGITGRVHKIEDTIRYEESLTSLLLFWWKNGFSHPRLTNQYRSILDGILGKPLLAVLLALIIPLTGFVVAPTLQRQLLPPAERNQFYIDFELPAQTSIEQTIAQIGKARELILEHPEIQEVDWFIGRNAPAFYYNVTRNRKNEANYAQGIVRFKSLVKNNETIRTIQKELDQAFPSTRVLVRLLEQGEYFPAPIELRIYGSDLDTLRDLGSKARLILSQVADVTHTRATISEVLPKIALQVDEEQARLAGLDNTAIAQQLDANLEGYVGGSVLEDTEELPVRVRLSDVNRSNLEEIASLDLISPQNNGSSIPLSALAKIELTPEVAMITRRNRQRVNRVQAFLTPGVLPATVLTEFKQHLEEADFQVPPGYSLEFGGDFESRNETVSKLMSTFPSLLLLMGATLVLSMGSFQSAGIVAIVGLFSIGISLVFLWIFNYPLGIMAIIGICGMVGVGINDSIVVLAAIRSHAAARKGNINAIREVIVKSTRHVIATTVTTVASFTPLLIGGGQVWPPLAVSVVSGIIGTTCLALFFVPCAYLLLVNRKKRFSY